MEGAQATYRAVFALELVLVYGISHVVSQSASKKLSQLLPASSIAVIVGLASQVLMQASGFREHSAIWDQEFFMLVLLPVIIFAAGWSMKRKLFYRRLPQIFSLAVVGTFVSLLSVAGGLSIIAPALLPDRKVSFLELLAFGSLISSTDPVSTLSVFERLHCDPDVHFTVLGESLLNDAVALTAFKFAVDSIEHVASSQVSPTTELLKFCMLLVSSVLLGYGLGILTALLFRLLRFTKARSMECTCLLCCCALTPFWIAEMAGGSGIVSVLFFGLASRRFVAKNLPTQAKTHASGVFTLAANLAEISIFLLLGLSAPPALASLDWGWANATLLICTIARALAVFPLLGACNFVVWLGLNGGGYAHPHSIASSCQHDTEEVAVTATYTSSATASTALSLTVDDIDEADQLEGVSTTSGRIGLSQATMIFLSGMRGAVAFACAQNFPDTNGNKAIVIQTTTYVVLVTLLVQGAMTESFVSWLGIAVGVDADAFLKSVKVTSAAAAKSISRRQTALTLSSPTSPDKDATEPHPSRRPLDWEERWLYPLVLSDEAALRIGLRPATSASASASATASASSHAATPFQRVPSWPLMVDARQAAMQRFDPNALGDTSGGGGFEVVGDSPLHGSPAAKTTLARDAEEGGQEKEEKEEEKEEKEEEGGGC